MKLSDFDYELPAELIAQTPPAVRGASRLLHVDGNHCHIEDRAFPQLPELLAPGDLLVINDTRVIPARLHGRKASGGRVEMLLERLTGADTALAQLRASRAPTPGTRLEFADGAVATVVGRRDELFELRFDRDLAAYLDAHGEVPLPPYIDRPPDPEDALRYQTVYARHAGAVAAPTAGLHFTDELFAALAARGIEHARLTLHVGLGTFAPVREENVEAHRLHAELAVVGEELCERVAAARARGGRVLAVGTTAVRALETAGRGGTLEPYTGDTRLFIYPGFRFRIVDGLVTNFHLPRSSLLMLVAAFIGHACMRAAYTHAVAARYRFFSYGDAMLAWPAA
ncbi:MAG TPA: tRNA preQ1(34) S-adenosylmethionine ribosyltransferase-isomerase QueA [Gammaproteobacteria bacterium]|nr:tRNA preQ1(34) S-adenosylmethionine ribosyltransferase-isomerase QueA [Gammaproteobacteria bacterium]